jgi:hypothetical protein
VLTQFLESRGESREGRRWSDNVGDPKLAVDVASRGWSAAVSDRDAEVERRHRPESLGTKPSVNSPVKALAEERLVFFECTVAAEHSFELEAGFDGDAL